MYVIDGAFNHRGADLGNHFCEYAGFDFELERLYPGREHQVSASVWAELSARGATFVQYLVAWQACSRVAIVFTILSYYSVHSCRYSIFCEINVNKVYFLEHYLARASPELSRQLAQEQVLPAFLAAASDVVNQWATAANLYWGIWAIVQVYLLMIIRDLV